MELNREQIVKGLEVCVTEKPCRECPLLTLTDDPDKCKRELMKHALALIRELTEEKERLNERLDREAKCQYDLATKIVDLRDDVKYIKADTVRKMQERFSQIFGGSYSTDVILRSIFDKIAKELLEDQE